MSTFKHFDSDSVNALTDMLKDMFQKFREQHGIAITFGPLAYSATNVEIKQVMAIIDDSDGAADARELELKENVKNYGSRFGLKEDMVGKKMSIPDKGVCRFIGIKPRAKRYPLVWKDAGNKYFKTTLRFVDLCKLY